MKGVRTKIFLLLSATIATITAWSGLVSAQSRTEPGAYQQNASFLSRRFLTDSKNAASLTDDLLPKADRLYRVTLLFPNGGLLDSTGTLDHAPFAIQIFLDHVSAYENANHASFTLMPYLNGYSLQDTAHAANQRLDLDNRAVRAYIVAECGRYVSANVPGSYVKGSKRVFDGIVLDLEPAGDPVFVAAFKTLLSETRASFDSLGLKDKKIGIAAPQHTDRNPKPDWGWNSSDYYYAARYVNYVIAMTYDSGMKDDAKYQSWMSEQTTRILQAVSGGQWNFDAAHPKPADGVKVLIGLPGFYTSSKAHDPSVENVVHGAPGVLDALFLLKAKDRTSLDYFQGAAMYTHDDGTAESIYARYGTDWAWWKKYWLGQ